MFMKWFRKTILCLALQASLSIEFSRQEYWVVKPFSRGSSRPRDWTQVSHIAGRLFTIWAIREITYILYTVLHHILYITKLPGTFYNINHIYFYRKRANDNAEGQNVSNRSTGDMNIDILCTDFAILVCFCNYIHIKMIFFFLKGELESSFFSCQQKVVSFKSVQAHPK